MKIKFIGAAREVTGSKHLITTDSGKKILLDCGMFQGKGLETDSLNRDLGFNPEDIDHVILTHAHIDHSGLIPYIYKLGFRGSIICTDATRSLCSIMLLDTAYIQESDARTFNKKKSRQGMPPIQPLYNQKDAVDCLAHFISIPYGLHFRIDENIRVKFTSTGHMLGGGVAHLEIKENGVVKRIAYTGDIGRPTDPMLAAPEPFAQADVLIVESTYGDRLHSANESKDEELLNEVIRTCVNKKGKLIIPSFSVGRTQELVFALNNAYNAGLLPKVKVYVDSPLAVNATTVFRTHTDCLSEKFQNILKTDADPLAFDNLYYITSAIYSKQLNSLKEPCIIISASGMMEAGRIKHHLANNIENSRNTILVVGYCAPTTLGARLLRGEKEVSIHGNVYSVKAEIRKIESFSGHGDYNEMIQFLSCQDKSQVDRVFVVHGEYESQIAYAAKLKEAGFKNVMIPNKKQEFSL